MSDTATITADEKKPDEKPKKKLEEPFNEYVTVRVWIEQSTAKKEKFFGPPNKNVRAYRKEVKGELFMWLHGLDVTGKPTVGSEITDDKGKVYLIAKLETGEFHYCTVVPKKTEPKRP